MHVQNARYGTSTRITNTFLDAGRFLGYDIVDQNGYQQTGYNFAIFALYLPFVRFIQNYIVVKHIVL